MRAWSSRSMGHEHRSASRQVLAVVFAFIGLGAIALLVARSDVAAVRRALGAAAKVAPFVLALEALRLALEARCTSILLRTRLPLWTVARAQLAGYAACI